MYRPCTRQMYYADPIAFIPKDMINENWIFIDDNLIPGVHPYYMISDMGNVYNTRLQRFMSQSPMNNGMVGAIYSGTFGSKTIATHTLVAKAFVPNPLNKPLIHHKNFKNSDNKSENIEWVTHKEKRDLMKLNGFDPRISHKNSIGYEKANEIKSYLSLKKFTLKEIANMCNVSERIVGHIKNGETWNDDYYKGKY